jgi:hypothetical protein
MAALTKSPAGAARRSSSSGGLRPILPFDLDDGSAVDEQEDDEDSEFGPIARESSGPFAGAGVDEVEYAYGLVIEFTCIYYILTFFFAPVSDVFWRNLVCTMRQLVGPL